MDATLTLVMAVFGQPQMLGVWWRTLESYGDLLDRVRLIVVDDHGDPPVEAPPEAIARHVEVYRILDDIPWNQCGARNLGMHFARGWCLMLDPDMVIERPMIQRFLDLASRLRRGVVVRYGLRHRQGSREGEIDMSSPNTYLIHRDDFFAAGGYDEEFRGHKGWSDVQLLDVLKAHYTVRQDQTLFAQFYDSSEIQDAQVLCLDRTVAHNKRLRINKKQAASKAGGWKRWVKRYKGPNLRFEWTKTH